jgi:outer membrane immunogenic protein
MRKQLLLGTVAAISMVASGAAIAAPKHHPVPPPAPAVPTDLWTGFYVGGNLGYSWGRSNTSTTFANSTTGALLAASNSNFNLPGLLGGAQLGYNRLAGNWLWGLEADIQAAGEHGNANAQFQCPVAACQAGNTTGVVALTPVTVTTFNQRLDWFGTVRGRIGVLATPAVAAYVTGGLAYGEISTSGTITGQTGTGAFTTSTFGANTTKAGWTLGAGVEERLSAQWSCKIEYLYMDLGTVNANGALPTNFIPLNVAFSSRFTDNIVRAGVNYRF